MGKSTSQIEVTIAVDKRRAWVNVKGPGSSAEEVRAALQDAGVTHGVSRRGVEDLFAKKDFGRNLVVARSTPMERGVDARIEYLISDEKISGKQLENGSIDFRSIDFVKSVEPGTTLIRKIARTVGEPEIGVTGKALQWERGKDFDLNAFIGKGAVIDENDPNTVIAEREGIYHRGHLGRVSVDDSILIQGDVDFEVGNIDTPSAIIIGGDLRGGFAVSSGRHITIQGVVENAQVKAGGDLTVYGGIAKGGRRIEAGGEIKAKYIYDRAHVVADSIDVTERIGHSDFRVTGEVKAKEIVGGKLVVGRRVEVANLGSSNNTLTDVEVGLDPAIRGKVIRLMADLDVRKRVIQALEKRRQTAEKKALALSKKFRAILIEKRELFSNEVVMKIGTEAKKNAVRVKEHEDQIACLSEEIESLQQEIGEYNPVISVRGIVFPGVTITLGVCEPFPVKKPFRSVIFRLDDQGEVEIVPYR
ncbi:MAG: DUF342 domain-containing protein [Candidatus Latescibacteria bacterium]|nr:DUF342 domain-containing protein [Candidatus Latescibacterota bacterium]